MKNENEIKEMVREKYAQIAKQASSSCGCGCGCSPTSEPKVEYSMMGDEYSNLEGHYQDADLGLGCGIPTNYAQIKKGDTVLDLGSGAGNDVFVARAIVGEEGKVIGLDMTKEMIQKAQINSIMQGYANVEFILGEIEEMPVEDNLIDVVVSNCVLNLVPNKQKAFSEIYRVLKPGGHFCVSDIVLEGTLPEKIQNAVEMYAGCISGASQKKDYLSIIEKLGFKNIELKKEKNYNIPEDIMLKYLSKEELDNFNNSGTKIISITVFAEK